jgi:hypothetical protein
VTPDLQRTVMASGQRPKVITLQLKHLTVSDMLLTLPSLEVHTNFTANNADTKAIARTHFPFRFTAVPNDHEIAKLAAAKNRSNGSTLSTIIQPLTISDRAGLLADNQILHASAGRSEATLSINVAYHYL